MGTKERAAVGKRGWPRSFFRAALALVLLYLVAAYVVAPLLWERYARRHPTFDDDPRITRTKDGHPGDPLNVALVGTQADVRGAMEAAGWVSADRLGLRSDVEIAAATVLGRSYAAAPVSKLYLFGRKEDLAFEKAAGDDPRRRNHVRLWNTGRQAPDGRPVWIGAASFDERVGFSHTTGEVTHHIAPDVDSERDRLVEDLEAAGRVEEVFQVPDFHRQREGRNGGGDPWFTDGALKGAVLEAAAPEREQAR